MRMEQAHREKQTQEERGEQESRWHSYPWPQLSPRSGDTFPAIRLFNYLFSCKKKDTLEYLYTILFFGQS